MARVRVLAWRLGNERAPIPRLAYSAQIYEDGSDVEPVWTCIHDHRTPIEAQACGLQCLADRTYRRRGLRPGAV